MWQRYRTAEYSFVPFKLNISDTIHRSLRLPNYIVSPSSVVLIASPLSSQCGVIYISMERLFFFFLPDSGEHEVVFGQHERPEDCAVHL